MTNLPSGQPDAKDGVNPLARLLGLVAAGLGVLTLLLGFTTLAGSSNFFEAAGPFPYLLIVLLIGGLLAGLGSIPKLDSRTPVAAVLVVGGFLSLLVLIINLAKRDEVDMAYGAYLVLLSALLLVVAAVGALLMETGLIAAQQRSARRGAGHPPGGFGQGEFGQTGAQGQYGQPSGSYAAGQQQGGYGEQGGYGAGQGQGQGAAQPYSGSYGAPAQQPHQPQQPQYGQPQQAAPYQQGQQQPEGDEADDQTRAYRAPTQSFGAYAPEGEQRRDNPYGPPPQQ